MLEEDPRKMNKGIVIIDGGMNPNAYLQTLANLNKLSGI
jgi:hypothetical protein